MRFPKIPPKFQELWKKKAVMERLGRIVMAVDTPLAHGRYLHWDRLRQRKPPRDLNHDEWWLGLKLKRRALRKEVALIDKNGVKFSYANVDQIHEALHQIDQQAGGFVRMPEQVTNSDTRDQYYVSSLIEESITSSQLEGASTTRPVAKELLRTGRKPRDKHEQMILNNYLTMRRLSELKEQPLTADLVFEIHRRITAETLEKDDAAGRFRQADEEVVVGDDFGDVFHVPPPAEQLGERMQALCEFANEATPEFFVHPVIRAIILHFWLAYDHPFVDGNGRTARALFYWLLQRKGYWLFEFISISHVLLKAPQKYGMAFLHCETDENDLTYFIIHQLEVIRQAVDELHAYIERKTALLRESQARLRSFSILNHRQQALIAHALRHPGFSYSIAGHRQSHDVAYQTARTDLLDLERRELLERFQVGNAYHFQAPVDLEQRIQKLDQTRKS